MQLATVQMEVERVMNLIRGFGWEKRKEEVSEGEIRLEIFKVTAAAEQAAAAPGSD